MSELLEEQTVSTKAVVRVSEGGRGFVVEHRRRRLVITAAHCLPSLPPPHPMSYLEERTYQKLLGPLGAKPSVWTECLFADPVADIAVLCGPDDQALPHQAKAYEALVTPATALAITDAPKQGRERVQGFRDSSFEIDTPGQGSALLLSLDGEWLKCAVTRRGRVIIVEDEALVAGGMSGSPIVSMDGKAIGLMSTGGHNPVLRDCLPSWFFRRR
jgi:hypothetical protein